MTTQELKIVTCVANLDDHIETLAFAGPVNVGPVAQWCDKQADIISITGRWLSKSTLFPRWCIRWTSGNGKGLFGKGLAGYSGHQIPMENIKHLPIVK